MDSLDAFYNGGPRTWQEAFPPVCIRTHWDPTMIVESVLPQAGLHANLAIDPRESFRICTSYYAPDRKSVSGPSSLALAADTPLPIPPELRGGARRPIRGHGVFFPPGGAASLGFPYKGFQSDAESDLLRLDEPLTKCSKGRYMPRNGLPASTEGVTGIEPRVPLDSDFVSAMAHAGCREADDVEAAARSSRLFFNPTRYDRTTNVPAHLYKAPSLHALPVAHNTFYK